MDEKIWVVDRIEQNPNGDTIAVMTSGAGEQLEQIDVPVYALPPDAQEGALYRVPDRDGSPNWGSAVRDMKEEGARMEQAEAILSELRARDPGGDIDVGGGFPPAAPRGMPMSPIPQVSAPPPVAPTGGRGGGGFGQQFRSPLNLMQ